MSSIRRKPAKSKKRHEHADDSGTFTYPLGSTCAMDGCFNPTRCPDDEPGEPFAYCDTCDAELACDQPEGGGA